MEKASKQNITTIIDNTTVSKTPTLTTTSVITTSTLNSAVTTATDSTCGSSLSHQSGTVLNTYLII